MVKTYMKEEIKAGQDINDNCNNILLELVGASIQEGHVVNHLKIHIFYELWYIRKEEAGVLQVHIQHYHQRKY